MGIDKVVGIGIHDLGIHFFHFPIFKSLDFEILVNMSEAPAPTAFISESLTLRLKRSIASKPTQLLEAPVSRIKRPLMPLIVALMTEALELNKTNKVLEIGTGSGYQTSILSLLSRRVYTIERINRTANLKVTSIRRI